MDRTVRAIVERNLKDRVADAVKLESAMAIAEEVQSSGAFLGLSERDLGEFSLVTAIRGKRAEIFARASGLGGNQFTGIEAESHAELVKRFGEPEHLGRIYIPADYLYRDSQAGVASAGGYLVGTNNVSFIERLRNRSVVFRLGAQRMPGQRENITVPKQTGGATVTWLSTEASQATESTPTFVQVPASPKTAAAYHEVTEQLLHQGGPAGEAIIRNGVADAVAVATDAAAIDGTGASGQPTGIRNTAGIGTASGTALGYTGLVAAQKTVADANAVLDPTALGYVTTPTEAERLKGRQRFTGTDSPLWRGAIHEGEIEGVRAMASKQMPSASMLYGDWSSVLIPEWGVLVVEVNPFQDFKSRIVGVRALWSMDVIVQHPSSFVSITSIT